MDAWVLPEPDASVATLPVSVPLLALLPVLAALHGISQTLPLANSPNPLPMFPHPL
jgi:hypothetical protein